VAGQLSRSEPQRESWREELPDHEVRADNLPRKKDVEVSSMRTVLKFTIPVEAGNATIRDGTLGKTVESILDDLKPEAAYFFPHNGERSGFVVFDLKEPSQIPTIAEPLFIALNAKVEFHPAMNVEDLKKALSGIDKAVKKYQHAGGKAA
jgi:hypothetical protein